MRSASAITLYSDGDTRAAPPKSGRPFGVKGYHGKAFPTLRAIGSLIRVVLAFRDAKDLLVHNLDGCRGALFLQQRNSFGMR